VRATAVSRFDPWVVDTTSAVVRTVIQYGDVDFDGSITMGDLTVLIDHLFVSFQPISPIQETGNFDCVGEITMGDLTGMINFLFISFDQNSPCNPY
jgi:hypothetical protein